MKLQILTDENHDDITMQKFLAVGGPLDTYLSRYLTPHVKFHFTSSAHHWLLWTFGQGSLVTHTREGIKRQFLSSIQPYPELRMKTWNTIR